MSFEELRKYHRSFEFDRYGHTTDYNKKYYERWQQNPSARRHNAYILKAVNIEPIVIEEKKDQDFLKYANRWEVFWSRIIVPRSSWQFFPICDQDLMVVGYYGQVYGNELLGHPGEPGKLGHDYLSSLDEVLVRGPLFVGTRQYYKEQGDGAMLALPAWNLYAVQTEIDGKVVAAQHIGTTNNGAAVSVDFSPLDLLVVKDLVKLGLKVIIQEVAVKGGRTMVRKLSQIIAARANKSLTFEVLAEGPRIAGTSIPEWIRLRVGTREFVVERNAQKLAADGKPIGPATKHLAEKAQGAKERLKLSQLDFPISSLAGALEEGEKRILNKAAQSGKIFTIEGWELGISTSTNPWRVYHAVYNPVLK